MDVSILNKFFEEFQNESDRAAAILGACYLDNALEALLKSFFINDDAFIKKHILGNSPSVTIDSFAKRSSICYALGLLRQSEYDDLDLIRRIRNKFAHKLHGLSFECQDIKDRCYQLKVAKTAMVGPLSAAKYTDSARFRYTISVGVIGNFINYRAENRVKHCEVFSEPLWNRLSSPNIGLNKDARKNRHAPVSPGVTSQKTKTKDSE